MRLCFSLFGSFIALFSFLWVGYVEAASEPPTPIYLYEKQDEGFYLATYPKSQKIFPAASIENYDIKNVFPDVKKSDDYYESIHILRDYGVINGHTDGTFKPNNSITRLQAGLLIQRLYAKAYVLLFAEPDKANFGTLDFKDVPPHHTAYEQMELLYRAGFIEVDAKGNINPNTPLTRGEMAKILAVAFRLEIPTTKGTFKDVAGSKLEPYVEALYKYGITIGYPDGTFKPNTPVSRAQYTLFLFRALTYLGDGYEQVNNKVALPSNTLPYNQSRWAETVTSFMYATPDVDIYTTVDVHEDNMLINEYNSDWNLIQSKVLPLELPIFGTFYVGENYNYFAYGHRCQ